MKAVINIVGAIAVLAILALVNTGQHAVTYNGSTAGLRIESMPGLTIQQFGN